MTFNFREAFASPSLAAEHQDAIREAMQREARAAREATKRRLGIIRSTDLKTVVLEAIRDGATTAEEVCQHTGCEIAKARQWVRVLETEGLIRVTRIASGVANRLEAIE